MTSWTEQLATEKGMESTGPAVETGFEENFDAMVGQMFDEHLSVSEYLQSGKYDERDRKLDKMIAHREEWLTT
jgi:hypothetical protein